MNYCENIINEGNPDNSCFEFDAEDKKILLVDDTSFFIEVEKDILTRQGNFQILTANSGFQALQVIKKEKPDLIYMDLNMDNMNGDECCRIVKKVYGYSIPVIMLTPGDIAGDFDRCWKSGCDGIITKPINQNLFVATTKKYLCDNSNANNATEVRQPARLMVKYGVDEQEETLNDYTIDMSSGGMFLATKRLLTVDTLLSVEFILPNQEKPISCKARVAWVNDPLCLFKAELPAGMGLQFLDLTLNDVDAIRGYLRNERIVPLW